MNKRKPPINRVPYGPVWVRGIVEEVEDSPEEQHRWHDDATRDVVHSERKYVAFLVARHGHANPISAWDGTSFYLGLKWIGGQS